MKSRTPRSLADYLTRTGQTQLALAARVQVSPATMCRFVNRTQSPSLPMALRLSKLTGVPIDALQACIKDAPAER